MRLVQILLPVFDNNGVPFPAVLLRDIHKELCDRFSGLTVYDRTPAEGVWIEGGKHERDKIVVVEVMDEDFDRAWWQNFRKRTEKLLRQDELVVRSQEIERL
jgi:hypothetical protein